MTVRIVRLRLGTLLLLLLLPQALKAQTFTYHWRTQETELPGKLKSGQTLKLKVSDLNRLCYSYEVTTKEYRSPIVLPDVIGFFSGTNIPASPELPTPSQQEPPAGTMTTSQQGIQEDIERIEGLLDIAETRLKLSGELLNGVAKAQQGADKAIAALYAVACTAGARGPGPDGQAAELAKVGSTVTDLVAKLPDVKTADTASATALSQVSKAKALIELLPPAKDMTPEQVTRTKGVIARAAQDQSLGESIRSNALAAAQKVDGNGYEARAAAIKSLSAVEDIARDIPISDDADSLGVLVRAIGRADVPSVKGTVLENPFNFLVKRLHRTFLSGGFLLSTLDNHDFVRANRSANVASKPDSVYSTFIDRRADGSVAFSPTVLINEALAESNGVSLYGSAGVAARSVGGRVSPDFLVGGSLGVADIILVTAALHIGRVQTLLLGDAAEVAGKPVPQTITPDQAVGERWRTAFALVVTVRLP